jgi:DNA-binding MarR family transcriptional regulator
MPVPERVRRVCGNLPQRTTRLPEWTIAGTAPQPVTTGVGRDVTRRSDLDDVSILIADVARMSRVRFDQRVRKLGLTRPQWRTLNCIIYNEGIQQRLIAGRMEVEPITVSRLVDVLEKRGWVERRPDPDDRRGKLLYLTPAAGPLLARLRIYSDLTEAETFAGFSPAEMEQLKELVARARHNLSAAIQCPADGDLPPDPA